MEPNTLLVKWPSVPVKSIEPEIVISDSAQFNSRTLQDIQKDT
jgi:hypothetical protein